MGATEDSESKPSSKEFLAKYADTASKASGDEVRDALRDLSPSSRKKLLEVVSGTEFSTVVQAAAPTPSCEDKLASECLPRVADFRYSQAESSNRELLATYADAVSKATDDDFGDALKALSSSSTGKKLQATYDAECPTVEQAAKSSPRGDDKLALEILSPAAAFRNSDTGPSNQELLAMYVDAASKASDDEVKSALKDLPPSSIAKLSQVALVVERHTAVQPAEPAPGVENKSAVPDLALKPSDSKNSKRAFAVDRLQALERQRAAREALERPRALADGKPSSGDTVVHVTLPRELAVEKLQALERQRAVRERLALNDGAKSRASTTMAPADGQKLVSTGSQNSMEKLLNKDLLAKYVDAASKTSNDEVIAALRNLPAVSIAKLSEVIS